MIEIHGTPHPRDPRTVQGSRFCDGMPRRKFIRIGFLGAGAAGGLGTYGISLADTLRLSAGADSRSGSGSPSGSGQASPTGRRAKTFGGKSVILIWQHGGPSQLDTFDMKPDAPSEYRGPYRQVESNVPGIPISEKMPYHAKIMDKATIFRGFTHRNGDHWAAAHWMLTGYLGANGSNRPARNPSMGAIASYLMGPKSKGVPSNVNFNDGGFGYHGASYLGVAYNPLRTGEHSYGNEAGRLPTADVKQFKLIDGLSEDRLMNRISLQRQFDSLRRVVDSSGTFARMDEIEQQATEMLLSGKTREAFDLAKESEATREAYGPGWGEQALLARRLIESGVRYVTLNTGYWDDHGHIQRALDDKLPRHDRAVGVLIQDLADRGLLDDTLVVTAGEFGRTPKINKDAGRDHWPQAQSILVAGGGYRHGQIVGSTNDKAEYPTSGAIEPADFCAIIYHALGLDPQTTIPNLQGRPVHLVPGGKVPEALF